MKSCFQNLNYDDILVSKFGSKYIVKRLPTSFDQNVWTLSAAERIFTARFSQFDIDIGYIVKIIKAK